MARDPERATISANDTKVRVEVPLNWNLIDVFKYTIILKISQLCVRLFASISCLIARRFLVLRELDFCLLPNPLRRFAIDIHYTPKH